MIEDDGLHKADAAVVLGGDGFCTRIMTAAQLATRGQVPIVYVSGPEMFGGHESDLTIAYAVRHGYAASLFRPIPSDSDSTRTESKRIVNYLRDQHVHSILLVTSNYHTRRAARLFRHYGPDLKVYAEPAPDPFFTPETWWQTRSGQRTFVLEWTKTLASDLGY